MKCPYCESPVSDTAQKCRHCGEWLKASPPDVPPHSHQQKRADSSQAIQKPHFPEGSGGGGGTWFLMVTGFVFAVSVSYMIWERQANNRIGLRSDPAISLNPQPELAVHRAVPEVATPQHYTITHSAATSAADLDKVESLLKAQGYKRFKVIKSNERFLIMSVIVRPDGSLQGADRLRNEIKQVLGSDFLLRHEIDYSRFGVGAAAQPEGVAVMLP